MSARSRLGPGAHPPKRPHDLRSAYLIELQEAQHRQHVAQATARAELQARFFEKQAKIVVPSSLESAVKARDLLLAQEEVDWEAYERATAAVLRLSPADPDPTPRQVSLASLFNFYVLPILGVALVIYEGLTGQDPTLLMVGLGMIGMPAFWERVVAPDPAAAASVAVLVLMVAGIVGAAYYGSTNADKRIKQRQAAYSRQIRDYRVSAAAQLRLTEALRRQYDESRPEGRLP